MQTYLEKMGSNFLVAAFIPSLAFVTAVIVIFGPIIPPALVERLQGSFNPLNQSGLVPLLLTVVIGFTLSSLNTFIYKIFEGYILLEHFSFARSSQQKRARRLKNQLRRIERRIKRLEGKDERRLQALKDQRYYIASVYHLTFPPSKQAILPTRFGNILRAAETYPVTRYGIDAVPIWPRLVHVIPDQYFEKVNQSNNQLAFLINCSLLCLIFAFLCSLGSLYQYIVFRYALAQQDFPIYFIQINFVPVDIYQQRVILYLAGCGFALLWSWLFYRATLPIASRYGNMIRSSFDLFRFQLLKQLNLSLPVDSHEEYDTWRMISEFITQGDSEGRLFFEYQTKDDEAVVERVNSDEAAGTLKETRTARHPTAQCGQRRNHRQGQNL
jgi:hypothetical protein